MGTGPEGSVFGEIKVQVQDLVRVVLLSSLLHGGQYSGKICFIEPQGIIGHSRPLPGAQAYPGIKVQVQDVVRVVFLPPLLNGGQFSGKIRFVEPRGGNG